MTVESKDYSYFEIAKLISYLSNKYTFLKTDIIGKSVLGKNIYALKIGEGDSKSLFAGAFHGSERITGTILLKFAEEILQSLENGKSIAGFVTEKVFKSASVVIVPFVNPDGCEIARAGAAAAGDKAAFIRKISKNNTIKYNANARGVDINHNFPAGWEQLHKKEQQNGIYGPSSTRYGGAYPVSEPETYALVNLCQKQNFKHVLAFHSQGEVIYHTYNKYLPKAEKQARLLASSSKYTLETPEGLAVGGGFKDYFIDKYSKPGFTIEIGKGENPLPFSDMEAIYAKIKEMMLLGIMM